MTIATDPIVIVDSQRLRREAVAAGLVLHGLDTTTADEVSEPARLTVVHEDAVHDWPGQETTVTFLLISSTRAGHALPRDVERRAFAILPARTTIDELAAAVRRALAGERPPAIRLLPAASPARGNDETLVHRLSPRERHILAYVASGHRNNEIGEVLAISTHTVRTHVQNILGKLEVTNRGAAVGVARRGGLPLDASALAG